MLIYFRDQGKTARRESLVLQQQPADSPKTLTENDDDGVGGFERRKHGSVDY